MGTCTEKMIKKYSITREDQDKFAIGSYEKVRAAAAAGKFDFEITDVVIKDKKGNEKRVSADEEPLKFFPDKFAGLKPAFAKDGTITPANASKLNDGACVFVLMSAEEAKARGLKPLARIVDFEDGATDPEDFGIAPAVAIEKLLKKTGISMDKIDYHEVNEAFAAVPIANSKILGFDLAKTNVHGGAVALGHPIGVSGARIILSLINVLKSNKGTLGLASICNGGGGASAIIIENM